MTRVARAFGQSPSAVLDWPWDEVLAAWYGLEEVERIERLEREVDTLHAAFYANYAAHNPKKLMAEQRSLRARLQAGDAPPKADEATLLRDALAFGAQIKANTEGSL